MRRINHPIVTFITVISFIVCFGTSIWFLSASQYNDATDPVPILRSMAPTGFTTANYRRNTDSSTFIQLTVVNTNLEIIADNPSPLFSFVSTHIIKSPWLVFGKISMPTRGDPITPVA